MAKFEDKPTSTILTVAKGDSIKIVYEEEEIFDVCEELINLYNEAKVAYLDEEVRFNLQLRILNEITNLT